MRVTTSSRSDVRSAVVGSFIGLGSLSFLVCIILVLAFQLIGDARVWQDDNVVSGDTITIYMAQDRTIVEGGKQERVKGVFYSQKDDATKHDGQPAPRRSAEVCKN